MPFELKDRHGSIINSEFPSVEEAKRRVPRVREWRQDESRAGGWNGWLPDEVAGVPMPGSSPDYMITFVPAPGS